LNQNYLGQSVLVTPTSDILDFGNACGDKSCYHFAVGLKPSSAWNSCVMRKKQLSPVLHALCCSNMKLCPL